MFLPTWRLGSGMFLAVMSLDTRPWWLQTRRRSGSWLVERQAVYWVQWALHALHGNVRGRQALGQGLSNSDVGNGTRTGLGRDSEGVHWTGVFTMTQRGGSG